LRPYVLFYCPSHPLRIGSFPSCFLQLAGNRPFFHFASVLRTRGFTRVRQKMPALGILCSSSSHILQCSAAYLGFMLVFTASLQHRLSGMLRIRSRRFGGVRFLGYPDDMSWFEQSRSAIYQNMIWFASKKNLGVLNDQFLWNPSRKTDMLDTRRDGAEWDFASIPVPLLPLYMCVRVGASENS